MQNISNTAVSNICSKHLTQKNTQSNTQKNNQKISQKAFNQTQALIDREAADFVDRKEAIAKLRVLKLRYDLVYPQAKHKCSFFNLLNDPAYRESSLLKFSYQHDALLSTYASQVLSLNLAGSLFSATPDLGREVFVKIYPINTTGLDTASNFNLASASIKLPLSISA